MTFAKRAVHMQYPIRILNEGLKFVNPTHYSAHVNPNRNFHHLFSVKCPSVQSSQLYLCPSTRHVNSNQIRNRMQHSPFGEQFLNHGYWIAVAQWLRCCATNRKVSLVLPTFYMGQKIGL